MTNANVAALARQTVRGVATTLVVYTVAILSLSATPSLTRSYTSPYPGLPPASGGPTFEGSVTEAYVRWLVRLVTGDLGRVAGPESQPVLSVVGDALATTAEYFLPAVVVAVTAGTLLQSYAVARGGSSERLVQLLVALLVGIPVFAYVDLVAGFDLAGLVGIGGSDELGAEPPLAELRSWLDPFLVTTVYLFALQALQAGPAFAEYVDESFVRTARAKGAGPSRIALHLLPHAAVRTATTLFTDMFGMVLIGLYVVEMTLGVAGFGTLTISAAIVRVVPVVVVTVVCTAAVAVVVNLLQDAYQLLIDPRVTDATGA